MKKHEVATIVLSALAGMFLALGVDAQCTYDPPYRQCTRQYERCISVKTNDGDLWVKAP